MSHCILMFNWIHRLHLLPECECLLFCDAIYLLSGCTVFILKGSMDDDFSQSLTPPVSPFAADSLCEMTPARPACFCCSVTKEEPTGALSTEGYAARGSLKRYSHHNHKWSNRFILHRRSMCQNWMPGRIQQTTLLILVDLFSDHKQSTSARCDCNPRESSHNTQVD